MSSSMREPDVRGRARGRRSGAQGGGCGAEHRARGGRQGQAATGPAGLDPQPTSTAARFRPPATLPAGILAQLRAAVLQVPWRGRALRVVP
eukprot:scaffold2643_cov387-Prasinococcus_capsulatus_cf.AAC.10